MQDTIVTIDAMGCQTNITEKIVDHKADYILAVKETQPQLYEHIQDEFRFAKHITKDLSEELGHGRIETRLCSIITDFQFIPENHLWKYLQTIIKIESKQVFKNKLHWTLDVSFSKDTSRKRINNATQNFSKLNKIALNLLKNEKSSKIGIKSRRLKAGWDNHYLIKVLNLLKK